MVQTRGKKPAASVDTKSKKAAHQKKQTKKEKEEEEKKKKNQKKKSVSPKKDDKKKTAAQKKQELKKKKSASIDKKTTNKKVKTDDKKIDNSKKDDAKKDDDKKDDEKIVSKVVKGGQAVDQFCPLKDTYHVYVTAQKAYDATLNQSNVCANNNKFYIIQLLQADNPSTTYYVWNRWGRVGVRGQSACKGPFTDVNRAIKEYESKLYDKSVKGDYRVLEITHDNGDEEEDTKKEEKKTDSKEPDVKVEDSKLPKQVQNLISLIFDLKMMNEQMKEIGYDAKKMPLGKLSKNNIQKGYEILKDLADAIQNNKPKTLLGQLSSDFYSYIPHDFGFKHMSLFILDTEKKVKDKVEMLQSISDIQIATKLLEELNKNENVFDQNYKKLKCDIQPLDKSSEEFDIIKRYVKNTHASTHSYYTLNVEEAFVLNKEGEDERFRKDITENKMLLWHGSRLTNYVGIISQGLRIAPPEAPVTGYMFGKGVYFADMVSKSANYCFTNRQNPTGLMILCEVACGPFNEKLYADYYANNLPKGKLCTKGIGSTCPPIDSYIDLNGFKVPIGVGAPAKQQHGSLLYNEYIVYDIKQIKMKYLLKMKFNYK